MNDTTNEKRIEALERMNAAMLETQKLLLSFMLSGRPRTVESWYNWRRWVLRSHIDQDAAHLTEEFTDLIEADVETILENFQLLSNDADPASGKRTPANGEYDDPLARLWR